MAKTTWGANMVEAPGYKEWQRRRNVELRIKLERTSRWFRLMHHIPEPVPDDIQ